MPQLFQNGKPGLLSPFDNQDKQSEIVMAEKRDIYST